MLPVTEQHEWLQSTAGSWRVSCQYFVEDGAPPMDAEGIDQVTMVGGFWRESHFQAEVLGSTTIGRMLLGYDPSLRCFVGSWCDSSDPFLYTYKGQLNEAQDTLELIGDNIDPTSGQPARYRSVEKLESSDRRTMELFVKLPDGGEFQVLRYQYDRT